MSTELRESVPVGDDIDARLRRTARDHVPVHRGVPADREKLLFDDIRDGRRDTVDAQDDRVRLFLDDCDAGRVDAGPGEGARERASAAG